MMPGLAPMAATFALHQGPLSSLQGAFQPKTSNVLDLAPESHKQPQMDPRRPGRWGTMHVCIAWQIHHHKLRVKTEVDMHAVDFSFKTDLLTKPPGSDLIQAIRCQQDLIQSSTPLSYPESYSKNLSFEGLGTASITAYRGPANPALNYPMIYHKEIVNPLGLRGTPKWWRGQKTPQSTLHQTHHSTEPEQPGRDSTRDPQDRDTEERGGQQLHLPREKMDDKQHTVQKHQGHNAAEHTHSPARDRPAPQTTTEEPQRSTDIRGWDPCEKKHELEADNYMKAKKIKKRVREDDQAALKEGLVPQEPTEKPLVTSTTHTPSSMSVQHRVPRLYPVNSTCNLAQVGTSITGLIPYPGAEGFPDPALSWNPPRDPLWDVHRAMDLPFSSRRELVTRATPLHGLVGAGLLEGVDSSYRQPHRCFPSCPPPQTLKQQESVYLMEREHLRMLRKDYYHCSLCLATMGSHLPHSSHLTLTYPRSNISRVGFAQSHRSSLLNPTPLPGSLRTLPPPVGFSLPLSEVPHRTTS